MYQFAYYKDYDYAQLSRIKVNKYRGKGQRGIYNNAVIMFDTETSKTGPVQYGPDGVAIPQTNIVVAFTLSVRYKGENFCTLYGNRPSELMECIYQLRLHMKGTLFLYCHNLAFDWVYLRKFFFRSFGYPKKQLNIKAHKPLFFKFENDIIIKDSYMLSGRSLQRWAQDLNVEHQKAVGSWDYDLIRGQDHIFTEDELHYIECDTLAGVECIEATCKMLRKNISSIPYTLTGIVREEVRVIGEKHRAHYDFIRQVPDIDTQKKLEAAFHGGFTHGNRFFYGEIITDETEVNDFCSSYPFIMACYPMPGSKWCTLDGQYSITEILESSNEYHFLFKFCAVGVELKDYTFPMPYLQFSKCTAIINPVLDNGRVISCDYCELYITSVDLIILNRLYNFNRHACTEVEYSIKRYLPRWYTDIVYKLFYDKSTLKGKDDLLYQIQKGKLNSLYGNCVTKPCRVTTEEDYETGLYNDKEFDMFGEYNKYINNYKSVLQYSWGVFVTAYAALNLFDLGMNCIDYEHGGQWYYSDTDSIYASKWDRQKLAEYNENCRRKLKENGYEPIIYEDKEYCLGVATCDGIYSEFCYLGAKRYACRDKETGKLKITVAGVPKKTGALCLNDDIRNFKKGFCFAGSITGKLQHSYIYTDEIYIDNHGNEVGDCIDLNYCNYILDQEQLFDFNEYVEVSENEAELYK